MPFPKQYADKLRARIQKEGLDAIPDIAEEEDVPVASIRELIYIVPKKHQTHDQFIVDDTSDTIHDVLDDAEDVRGFYKDLSKNAGYKLQFMVDKLNDLSKTGHKMKKTQTKPELLNMLKAYVYYK